MHLAVILLGKSFIMLRMTEAFRLWVSSRCWLSVGVVGFEATLASVIGTGIVGTMANA